MSVSCLIKYSILHHRVRNSAIFISYPSPVFPWHRARHTIHIFKKKQSSNKNSVKWQNTPVFFKTVLSTFSLPLPPHFWCVCQDKSLDLSDFVSTSVSWEHSNLLNWCKMSRTMSGYLIKAVHHYYLSSWLSLNYCFWYCKSDNPTLCVIEWEKD